MKKVVFIAIVCLSVVLGACKHSITTQYTIGCLGYQYNTDGETDWSAVESYFQSQVAYNQIVTYENETLPENDAEALQFYNGQIAKLDTAYVCSMIKGTDYIIYGIATLDADGTSYRILKSLKFQASGVEE